MSRKSNTEQRRKEIVEAMLIVIAEHGYEKATIQAIARQAGLAPGLIHYHFKSKEQILLHLVKSFAQISQDRFLALAETAATPMQKLRAYIDARLGKGQGANPEAVAAWVMIGSEAVRQSEVRRMYQQAVAAELVLLQELLTNCLAAEGKRTEGAEQLAAALLAFMAGAFQLASAAADVMPKGYAARAAIQWIERFIDAEAGSC